MAEETQGRITVRSNIQDEQITADCYKHMQDILAAETRRREYCVLCRLLSGNGFIDQGGPPGI